MDEPLEIQLPPVEGKTPYQIYLDLKAARKVLKEKPSYHAAVVVQYLERVYKAASKPAELAVVGAE